MIGLSFSSLSVSEKNLKILLFHRKIPIEQIPFTMCPLKNAVQVAA
jgi:hypothetical protein